MAEASSWLSFDTPAIAMVQWVDESNKTTRALATFDA